MHEIWLDIVRTTKNLTVIAWTSVRYSLLVFIKIAKNQLLFVAVDQSNTYHNFWRKCGGLLVKASNRELHWHWFVC